MSKGPPVVYDWKVEVLKGQGVRLKCNYTAHPDATISWTYPVCKYGSLYPTSCQTAQPMEWGSQLMLGFLSGLTDRQHGRWTKGLMVGQMDGWMFTWMDV